MATTTQHPVYLHGRGDGIRDVYEDLFDSSTLVRTGGVLNLNVTEPLETLPLHRNVVRSMGSTQGGEDFVNQAMVETGFGSSDVYFPTGDYYRQKGGTYRSRRDSVPYTEIYPRLQDPKARASNYSVPRNHIRSMLYIGKQADSERGAQTDRVNHTLKYRTNGMAGVGTEVYTKDVSLIRLIGDDLNPPKFDPSMFAERLGFKKNPVPITAYIDGQAVGFDASRADPETGKYLVSQPSEKHRNPSSYGPRDPSTAKGAAGQSLVQYQVEKGFISLFADANLHLDHTIDERRQKICHQTVAASPYYWLDVDQWRHVAETQAIDFLPFVDPLTPTGEPTSTRPITYRFWDSVAGTRMYAAHNPTFECTHLLKANELDWFDEDIPDMQHYRDAITHFHVDETTLVQWHKAHYPDATEEELMAAALPRSYVPMENSSTMKDVEFQENIQDPYFKPNLTMAKRRMMHYETMCKNNPNAIRDYRNTFCETPTSVKHADLTHYRHNTRGNLVDSYFANMAEFKRLTRGSDMSAAASVFNPAVNHSSMGGVHKSITSALLQIGMTELNSKLKRMRSEAIEKLMVDRIRPLIKTMSRKALETAIQAVSGYIKPETMREILRAVSGAAENATEEELMSLSTNTIANMASMGTAEVQANLTNYVRDYINGHVNAIRDQLMPTVERTPIVEEPTPGIPVGEVIEEPPIARPVGQVLDSNLKTEFSVFGEADLPIAEGFEGGVAEAVPMAELVVAEIPEAVVMGEVVAEPLVGAILMEAALPIMMELAPIVVLTGLIIGFTALIDHFKKEYEDEQERLRREAEIKQKQEDFKRYYSEMIPIDLGQYASTYVKQYLERTYPSADFMKNGYMLPYSALVKKILTNELSIHVVDAQWLEQNSSTARGHDILMAETIREMRLVDYYLRDSPARIGTTGRAQWQGGSPFPPILNDPMTFVKDAMTPLPILSKSILLQLMSVEEGTSSAQGDLKKYYGDFVPSVIRTEHAASSVTLEDGTEVPIGAHTKEKIPVPVFVGFLSSPTGFVSSEDGSMAWPTKARKGGLIPPLDRFVPPTFTPKFQEASDLGRWLSMWEDAMVLKGPRTGLLFTFPGRDDMWTAPGVILTMKNKTGRKISLISLLESGDVYRMKRVADINPDQEYDLEAAAIDNVEQCVLVVMVTADVPKDIYAQIDSNQLKALGCYKDSAGDRALSTRYTDEGALITPNQCVAAAGRADASYIGFQNQQGDGTVECYFGDEGYDKHGKATNCFNLKGAAWSNYVFQVDKTASAPKSWADVFLSSTNPSMRTVYFRYNRDTWPYHMGLYSEVHIVGTRFVCQSLVDLMAKIEQGRKKVESKEGYKHVRRFFDEVASSMVVQSEEACYFAEWLTEQFGAVAEIDGGYDSPPVMLYEPHTARRQRALYFAWKWIWTKKTTELSKGRARWDRIYTTLLTDDTGGGYILPGDEDLFKEFTETGTLEDPIVAMDITPPPAGKRDVGYVFTEADMDIEVLSKEWDRPDGGGDGYMEWMGTLWTKAAYFVSGRPGAWGEFASLAYQIYNAYSSMGLKDKSFMNALWKKCLPILNNATSYMDKDPVLAQCEHVRRARLALARGLKAGVTSNVLEHYLDVKLSAAMYPINFFLSPPDLRVMSAAKFTLWVWYIVRTVLRIRELSHFNIRDFYALQTLDDEAQLFARMADDTYKKSTTERLHLEDPQYYSTYWFQEALSSGRMSVYYNPSEKGVLKTPCVVVAFRGTKPQNELDPALSTLTSYFRLVTDSEGDLLSNLHILTGTQITSARFQKAAEEVSDIVEKQFPDVPHVYLTGHSLGGTVAMHVLDVVRSERMVKATVFNPGIAADANYLQMVNELWSYEMLDGAKRPRFDGKHPWTTKLVTHQIGGENSALINKDPVSIAGGGLGIATYHYEGGGVPSSFYAHSMKNFPKGRIYGVRSVNTVIPTHKNFLRLGENGEKGSEYDSE